MVYTPSWRNCKSNSLLNLISNKVKMCCQKDWMPACILSTYQAMRSAFKTNYTHLKEPKSNHANLLDRLIESSNYQYLACFAHEAWKNQKFFKSNGLINLSSEYTLKSLQTPKSNNNCHYSKAATQPTLNSESLNNNNNSIKES